ncbi:RING finger protein 38 [Plakobranchus ocellatus]|uniref:RING finger protein 38 n=1 Tax=Plakobranchus ocellatus TaxID=259542 RepID=A0AAV4CAR0_9GAST|nr:RING finger protein 38 [Plakobranchus ocellatus]
MTALRSVAERPQEARRYQEQFRLYEGFEYCVASQFTTEAIQHNATATQNDAVVTQHRVAIARHLATEAQHNAEVTQHFAAVTEHVAAAAQQNDVVTQHIIAATEHISAAIHHNDAATQRRSAMTQHIAAATHNSAAQTQSSTTATHLSDNDIQRLTDFQLTFEEDVGDTLGEIGQVPDYHSSPDNGLSEDKIQEIPTRQFSRGAERSGSDQTCVFCMCDFEDKQLLRILPCFHQFHAECVDEWLKVRLSSPSLSSSEPRCNQNRNYSRADVCLLRRLELNVKQISL